MQPRININNPSKIRPITYKKELKLIVICSFASKFAVNIKFKITTILKNNIPKIYIIFFNLIPPIISLNNYSFS